MAAPKLKYAIGNASSTTLSSAMANTDTTTPMTATTNFQAKTGEGMALINEGGASEELAYSTGLSGSALVTPLANRGLEGGSAQGHDSGESVKGVLSAGMWNDMIDALVNVLVKTTGVLDTTKVVDLTTSQTLTTKTLAAPIHTGTSTIPTVQGAASAAQFVAAKGLKDHSTAGTTETVDWSQGDRHLLTLDENVTITFSNAAAGQTLTLLMLQDGSGTNTITFADTIVWADNTTPTWTTTASKMNIAVITYTGSAYFGVGNKFA